MSRAKQAVLPAYLFLCLLLGGSTQGIWANAILQLLAVGVIAWALLARDPPAVPRAGRHLLLITGGLGLLFLLQLVPLPPALWAALPGRGQFEPGFALLGVAPPWLPLSQAPYDTATTALTLLPPLALLIGMLRLRAWTTSGILAAIAGAAALSVMLGVLQVTGGDQSWYFYKITNLGVAVGAFANANHFATLLLVMMPVVAALFSLRRRAAKSAQQRSLGTALAMIAGSLLVIGILVNGSSALLLLGLPVAAASILLALPMPLRRVRQGLAAAGLALAIAAAVLVTLGKDLPGWGTNASIETRMEFWTKTVQATRDQVLAGSGFGTFQQVYRQYDDPGAVNRWYANHAHNDYLEVVLEGGLPALLVLAWFLLWWLRQSGHAWLTPAGTVEQKAAAVAAAAILLHSAFDYPLRTAAMMAVMAACLALLSGAKGATGSGQAEGQPRARHAVL
jgi:O-antigen ligase